MYGLAGGVHTWERRLMTAQLDLGAVSVVSHHSAAVIHRLPDARPGPPELTVPAGAGRSHRWRVHETDLASDDRTMRHGIRVTTLTRTVLDLAAVSQPAAVESLVDNLLADRRLRLGPFTAAVLAHRGRGRRGTAVLATIVDERGPGYVPPASELEALLFGALRAGGFPDPVRQHVLPARTSAGLVDAAYPAARLIIEADGRRWHTRVADFERDRRRDIEAGLLGWRVVRFVWDDLVHHPEWVCEVVGTHLRRSA